MPIEMDHPAPPSRELYRFRPWSERPLTQGQVRACLVACWSVVLAIVVACGAAVWTAGWPVRWLVEPIVLVVIALLAMTCRDVWADVSAKHAVRSTCTAAHVADPEPRNWGI